MPFPGTSSGYAELRDAIERSQTPDDLRRNFDHLLNFRSENPDSLIPVNVRSIVPVFTAAARIEANKQPCAPMIAARLRTAADREQVAGQPDPYLQRHLEGAHYILGQVTRRGHPHAPQEVNPRPHFRHRIDVYRNNQRLHRHEANLRIIDHLTQQGLIRPDFYAAMLQSPINERYPEVLTMLYEQLSDPSGAVLDALRAGGSITYTRALQNSIRGAIQMAVRDERRNTTLLDSVAVELSDKNRPDAVSFGKTIKVSNVIVNKMKKAGLATPDVTSGRNVEDLRNIGQAVAVILRASRRRNERPDVKAALDAEDELLVGIIENVALLLAPKDQGDAMPMTVGDLVMRYPDAEPAAINRMVTEHQRTGTIRHMHGKNHSWGMFAPGHGEVS